MIFCIIGKRCSNCAHFQFDCASDHADWGNLCLDFKGKK